MGLAGAVADIELALGRARSRGGATRRRRHVVHLIDRAIGLCEARNLGQSAPDLAAPALAASIVRWLRAEAGETAPEPATNQAALDELFRLQVDYLLAASDRGED